MNNLWLWVGIPATALLCLAWFVAHYTGWIGYRGLVQHPLAHHKQQVVLPLVRVEEGDHRSFVAHKGTLAFTIDGPMPGSMQPGSEWTLLGTFDGKQQHLILDETHPAPGRKGKKALGFLGLGLGLFLLPMAVRREGYRLAIRG